MDTVLECGDIRSINAVDSGRYEETGIEIDDVFHFEREMRCTICRARNPLSGPYFGEPFLAGHLRVFPLLVVVPQLFIGGRILRDHAASFLHQPCNVISCES